MEITLYCGVVAKASWFEWFSVVSLLMFFINGIEIALRLPAVAPRATSREGASRPPPFLPCQTQDSRMHKKTLKRTRKFVVDGVEVSVTTSKIISEDEKKDEEMRFLRQVDHWEGGRARRRAGAGFSSPQAKPGAT